MKIFTKRLVEESTIILLGLIIGLAAWSCVYQYYVDKIISALENSSKFEKELIANSLNAEFNMAIKKISK